MATANASKLVRRESPDQSGSPRLKYSLREAIKIVSRHRHGKSSATTSPARFTTTNTVLQPTLDTASDLEATVIEPEATHRTKSTPISPSAASKFKLASVN